MRNRGMGRPQVVAVWGSGILVITAAAAACLLRGMFFAREMYGMLAVWFVLCAAIAASSIYINGGYKSGGTAVKIVLGGPLLILVLYAFHLLHSPLSVQGTVNELLRWGLYASFAFFAFLCAGTRRGFRLLAVVWHGLGITISLSALLTVCGGLPLRFAVAYTASPEVSVTGARLGGLLQYPNAFGAVMAVFLLERMFALAPGEAAARHHARGEHRAFRAARQPLRMLPLFPYAAALLLSESRGALLAAACAAAAALLWKRRLAAPLLAAGAAPVAAAALFYRQLARTGLAVEPLPGLLLLAGFWAGALLAGLWLCRRSRLAAGGTRAALLLLAAALWTAAGTAVLSQVRERISGPSATVSARGLMYRDAWKLAGEAPWLGQGGETWHSAYLATQSRPYVGSQVHSGYLDFLLNLGIAGVAVLLLLLLAAVWMTGRDALRLLPPLLVIVLHAAADFDWSYGLSWLLLFLLLAMAHAESRQRVTAVSGTHAVLLRPAFNRRAHIRGFMGVKRAGLRLILICICLTFSWLSFQMRMGEKLYSQAVRTAEPAAQITLLRESLGWNPRDSKAAVVLAGLLPGEQGRDLLRSSLIYAPEDPGLHWALAGSYMGGDDPGKALYWVRRSLQLDGFNAAKQAKAAEGMLELGRRNLVKGDQQRAAASASAGLELLRQYRLLAVQERSKGGQHNDRRFEYIEPADMLNMELEELLAAVYAEQAAASGIRLSRFIPSSAGR
ncbi:hypothetical protein PAECIP111892_05138 [Paenibacillus auburnensis]|uniref:O-antigen ligase-related domain-containing protein n=1 Tax=Paenibacillus auburnensis TaxID=2905649 RepID=A0ABM9CSH5_9BACL|nr:O-antigen ligase family protein [Paenibacillus auburnensis]CAH1222334.1 hypothetical protein PAECIP111892_05138 [Paenibacillus auburnensis]